MSAPILVQVQLDNGVVSRWEPSEFEIREDFTLRNVDTVSFKNLTRLPMKPNWLQRRLNSSPLPKASTFAVRSADGKHCYSGLPLSVKNPVFRGAILSFAPGDITLSLTSIAAS